jgi:hypothetical protein
MRAESAALSIRSYLTKKTKKLTEEGPQRVASGFGCALLCFEGGLGRSCIASPARGALLRQNQLLWCSGRGALVC